MSLPEIPELPAGIRSRTIDNGNGLVMHYLEAGFENGNLPCLLLLAFVGRSGGPIPRKPATVTAARFPSRIFQ